MYLFLVKLSENDKRVIIALLIAVILLFIIIGYFVHFFRWLMRQYGKGIDTYVGQMLQYQLITKPKQVKSYVWRRENRTLVKKLAIPTLVFLAVGIIFAIYAGATSLSGTRFGEIISSVGFKLDWSYAKFFGSFNIINDWPKITKYPSPIISFQAYMVYIFVIVSIIYLFMLMRRSLILYSRVRRSQKMSKHVFSKNLENMHFEQI